jgi:DNA-3-methyladenine glycosylase II
MTASQSTLEQHFAAVDPVLAGIVALAGRCALGKRRKGAVFETLSRSIASQQLSGVVARRILERLEALFGGQFPTPAQILEADVTALRGVGFSYAKIAALQDLAAKTRAGTLPPDEALWRLDDEAVIEHCVAVRGIGRWTAEMLLMFHLGRADVLPVADFGVCNGFRLAYGLKGMPRPKALLAFGERWRPYRSAAAWYLWRAVDLHREAQLPSRPGRAPRIQLMPSRPAKQPTQASQKKQAA